MGGLSLIAILPLAFVVSQYFDISEPRTWAVLGAAFWWRWIGGISDAYSYHGRKPAP